VSTREINDLAASTILVHGYYSLFDFKQFRQPAGLAREMVINTAMQGVGTKMGTVSGAPPFIPDQGHARKWMELCMRIREIAQTRVRCGYRKIRVLLNREGWNVGRDLVYRLYKEEGLMLKKRLPRRRKTVRTREERFVATAPNQAWSLDFVSDQLQSGTRFRALTTIDVYTRECIAIEVGQSLKGTDVVRVLTRLKQQRGLPRTLFCDNGSEFASHAMDLPERGADRFFAARQADRQRIRRELQRNASCGMLERALVYDPGRSQGADPGLAPGIQ